MVKYQFYADPGHGWLKVKMFELVKLGIADKISSSSYMRRGDVFLEEDGDATLFIKTMEQKGKKVETVYHSTNNSSKIRNYRSYKYAEPFIPSGMDKLHAETIERNKHYPYGDD